MRDSRRLEEPLPARLEGEETGRPGASTEDRKVDAGSGSCGITVIERPGTKVSGLFVFGDTVPMGWLAAKETFGLRFVDS